MDVVETSKYLASLLRHRPGDIGLTLDSQGWTEISELLALCAENGTPIGRAELDATVQLNDKKRFTVSDDGLRIRAAQGHTTKLVKLEFKVAVPPTILYHGTIDRFVPSILKQGLTAQKRHHVHLSKDVATAQNVGARRKRPVVIFRVDAKRMLADGLKFYLSDNEVWLTEAVLPRYLSKIS